MFLPFRIHREGSPPPIFGGKRKSHARFWHPALADVRVVNANPLKGRFTSSLASRERLNAQRTWSYDYNFLFFILFSIAIVLSDII